MFLSFFSSLCFFYMTCPSDLFCCYEKTYQSLTSTEENLPGFNFGTFGIWMQQHTTVLNGWQRLMREKSIVKENCRFFLRRLRRHLKNGPTHILGGAEQKGPTPLPKGTIIKQWSRHGTTCLCGCVCAWGEGRWVGVFDYVGLFLCVWVDPSLW